MRALTVAVSIIAWAAGAGGQELSSADIAAAIEQGRAGKTLQKKCGAYGENGFDIIVEGPVGRIMRAAREAKDAGREFTAADVSPAIGGPVLTVTVRRDPTLRAPSLLAFGEAFRAEVVLRSKQPGPDGPLLLKPIRPVVYTDSGAFNDVRRSRRPEPNSNMVASFNLAAFRAMPQGDVEVVAFMTDAGERTCKINDKDRSALR